MKNFVHITALALSLALLGCSQKQDAQNAPGKQAAADVSAGKAIAEQQCKGCHGIDGKGVAPAIPNLAGQRERYLVAALGEYGDGKRSHAALRELATQMTAADARNVAAYYAGLPPIAPAKSETAVVAPYDRGKAAAQACARCHGEDGNSKAAGIPNLAGQQPRYFVNAIQEYLMGAREVAPMHALVRDMKRVDLEDVALYFASQTPTDRAPPASGNPAAGEPLTAVCGGCHGARGLGDDASTPRLAAQDPEYLVRAIKSYRTTRKNPGMQRAVAALSDQDIENIAAFYSVQKSKPAEDGQHLIQDLTDKCERCHGSKEENPVMAIPNIRGQDEDYLVMAMRAYRDDRRQSSVMHVMSLPYSDTIIENIAAYYASQPPK